MVCATRWIRVCVGSSSAQQAPRPCGLSATVIGWHAIFTTLTLEGEGYGMDGIKVTQVKHMAFAVRDVDATLATYKRLLGVPADVQVSEFPKSRNRVAVFDLGGVEYQISQSMDPDGRFAAWIDERGGEGLHHICYAVEDIDAALAEAEARGATLKECSACKVTGSHVHPEGWVAFLQDDAGGIEIEFMQVYTPEQLEQYKNVKGI